MGMGSRHRKIIYMLLFVVGFALLQGALHELLHRASSCVEHSHEQTTSHHGGTGSENEGCHNNHQACNALSCYGGTGFVATGHFINKIVVLVALLAAQAVLIRLPILSNLFFKPPVAFAY
jgi:hypothetical protein